MIRFTRILLGLLGLGMLITLGSTSAREVAATSPALTNTAYASWDFNLVDSTNDVGMHPSLARHPHTGQVYMSYYDATNKDLRLAKYVGSGGNCGTSNSWSCEVVDAGDTVDDIVGMYSSLAFDPVSGWAGIAYYAYNTSTSTYGIKYAGYFCTPHNCSWGIVPIVTSSTIIIKYKYPSLKIGTDRMPRMAYYRETLGDDQLYYAMQVNTGGNCGPTGSWQCDSVDTGIQIGLYPSLALTTLTTPLDNPYIAYYDGGAGDLKYAWYLGNGTGNCGGNDWNCYAIDTSGDVGRYPSLVLGQGSTTPPGIAYYDAGNGRVKYAYYVNTLWPGNCGTGLMSTKWQCDGIKNTATTGWMSIDLDTYTDGTRAMVFGCPDCYGQGFFYAERVGIGGTGCLGTVWSCQSMNPLNLLFHDLSQFVELDISDADVATIAFYDATDGDTWVAQKNLATYLPMILSD